MHRSGERPCKWGFFTDWNEFAFDAGEPTTKFHGSEVSESRVTINLKLKPFRLIIFWNNDRLVWLGDREWKKNLVTLDRD